MRRKSEAEEKKYVNIMIQLDEGTYKYLAKIASLSDVTTSQVISVILAIEACKRNQNKREK
jgi:hypothetical protein